jgi:hypothetical protein
MANEYIALPPEVEASYAAIIDNILAVSDLNTISAKRIRKGLQERLDYDIAHQKVYRAPVWILVKSNLGLIHSYRMKSTRSS